MTEKLAMAVAAVHIFLFFVKVSEAATEAPEIIDIPWMEVSGGTDYTMGITKVETLIIWGTPMSEIEKLQAEEGKLWSKVWAGSSHSCGRTVEGDTVCWGRNNEGQLNVPAGHYFKELSLGAGHTCGLTNEDRILCWGAAELDRLDVPPGDKKWTSLGVGTYHTCAVSGIGEIFCWGEQGYGRKNVPYTDEPDIYWEQVTCGDRHCCGMMVWRQFASGSKAFRGEDNVACWGNNWMNQLEVPAQTEGRAGVDQKFVQLTAGSDHTCGLTISGKVWCWGYVEPFGLVSDIPDKNFTRISSGGRHTCGVDVNLMAYCWGYDMTGQATVPRDDRTVPPSILEYSDDPRDIYIYEDPWNRVTKYIPSARQHQKLHSFQHIEMSIFLPEYAKPGSLKLVFTHVAGTPDPYSPHVLNFVTPEFDKPGTHKVSVSAFNLENWHRKGLGRNPKVTSVDSQTVGGVSQHALVDGGEYRVDAVYADSFGHRPQNHTLECFRVTYDLETLSPILRTPVSGYSKQALLVQYELLEDMEPESLWVVMKFKKLASGVGYRPENAPDTDESSPHEIQFVAEVTKKGNHSIMVNLGDPEEDFYGVVNPLVNQTRRSGPGSNGRELVTGGTYTFELRCFDVFINDAKVITVADIDYWQDVITEPVDIIRPVDFIYNPFAIEYRIPEQAFVSSLEGEMVWIENRPDEIHIFDDPQPFHKFWVKPHSEIFGEIKYMVFGTANLFKDLHDEDIPQQDMRKFFTKDTPVRSYLAPFAKYKVTLSYQDIFLNPRAFSTFELWTNFTEPSTPDAPVLLTVATATMQIGWRRNETGGVRISNYDVEFREIAKNTTVPLPEWATVLFSTDRQLTGQESNDTVFISLKSSTYYKSRVRACNLLGCSGWTDWSVFRTLSACGDGVPLDGEKCDDGNLNDDDGCSSECIVEEGWVCFNRLEADPSNCSSRGMDGLRVKNEECDDCNNIAGDGCSPEGEVEFFWTCQYQGRLGIRTECHGVFVQWTYTADNCTVVCGDGLKHFSEECDDGNLIDGDGCSKECTDEEGFNCVHKFPDIFFSNCHSTCGDNRVLGNETCDDGNAIAGDGCNETCGIELGWTCWSESESEQHGDEPSFCEQHCTDGVIQSGETCDDANSVGGDGCGSCQVEEGWTCVNRTARESNISSGSFCAPICGDGFRISGLYEEECDDGNVVPFDGCDSECKIELGYRCEAVVFNGTVRNDNCTAICGDGFVVRAETCDDGNTDSDDGCSDECLVEQGYHCDSRSDGRPARCVYKCGDGIVSPPNETCDDGNSAPNDGCSDLCQIEFGWRCGAMPGSSRSICKPFCGDGIISFPEKCDDGGMSAGDGCDTECQIEKGWICAAGRTCAFVCGDGIRMEGEDCDDGNLKVGDGCDSNCMVEDHWKCESWVLGVDVSKSVCTAICGDGRLVGNEECDDGNRLNGDGCDENCTIDGECCEVASGGIACVAGNATCPNQTDIWCGNGFRTPGEECDDGNRTSGDGCDGYCKAEPGWFCTDLIQGLPDVCVPKCRDGIQVGGELCDDGNDINGDGCDSTCKVEQGWKCTKTSGPSLCGSVCGDGFKTLDEECDDNNTVPMDGCSQNCRVERGFACHGGSLNNPDVCIPVCGDGLVMDGRYSAAIPEKFREQCDSGTDHVDVGCDALTCRIKQGFACRVEVGDLADTCKPVCGDGIVIGPEEDCDDNNSIAGDGCSSNCSIEPSWGCSYSKDLQRSVCTSKCGDGRKTPSEICDDGNLYDGDGCSSQCDHELGFECLGGNLAEASVCFPFCGDGVVVFGEECDDANQESDDGCTSDCKVEPMYFCERGERSPDWNKSSVRTGTVCERTCGNKILDGNEECDDRIEPDPLGIMNNMKPPQDFASTIPPYCENCLLAPGHVCGDGRRLFTRELQEDCDDGNRVDGDGCNSTCQVELGWECKATPLYVDPPKGDQCAPLCGDGIRLFGYEDCDDGNSDPSDGCSGFCQVEPFWYCFHNASHVQAANGSYCVEVVPPVLIRAGFDDTFARIDLPFSRDVVRFGGNGDSEVVEFECALLLDKTTIDKIGEGPVCRWNSRKSVIISLGKNPNIKPQDPIEVMGGVLRSRDFSHTFAPAHSQSVSGPRGAVLRPLAAIVGPEIVSTCVKYVFLDSSYSRRGGGRAFLTRWEILDVIFMETQVANKTEKKRMEKVISTQWKNTKVVFVRKGSAYDEIDLDVDRSLRAGHVYRIRVTVENFVGLKDSAIHNLQVIDTPLPVIIPLVDQINFKLDANLWMRLIIEARVPQECSEDGAAVRLNWTHVPLESGGRKVDLEPFLKDPPVELAIIAGIMSPGYNRIVVTACANLYVSIWNYTKQAWNNYTSDQCSSLVFTVDVMGEFENLRRLEDKNIVEGTVVPEAYSRQLTPDSTMTIGKMYTDFLGAVAGAKARLVTFALGGNFMAGESEPKNPLGEFLNVLENPAENAKFSVLIERGWFGGLDANRTMIIGAVVIPSENATDGERKALSWVRSRVTWEVKGATSGDLTTIPALGMPTLGGSFLTIPPGQIMFGSKVSATAKLELHVPGDESPGQCSSGLRSFDLSVDLITNQPPAAGFLDVRRRSVSALQRVELNQLQWADNSYPMQYRFAEYLPETDESIVLTEWGFVPKATLLFLGRRNATKYFRGWVRDSMGSMMATETFPITISSGSSVKMEAMYLLSEFKEGYADLSSYRSDLLTSVVRDAMDVASAEGPAAMMQLVQEIAYKALTRKGVVPPPENCSTDCGIAGECLPPTYFTEDVITETELPRWVYVNTSACNSSEVDDATLISNLDCAQVTEVNYSAEENETSAFVNGVTLTLMNRTVTETTSRVVPVVNWAHCVCPAPYTGIRCHQHPVELDTQYALTGQLMLHFLEAVEGTPSRIELPVSGEPETLERLVRILQRIIDDCRRVTFNVLEATLRQLYDLLSRTTKSAKRQAMDVTVKLISRAVECIPIDDNLAPPAQGLGHLGSSAKCHMALGTKTTVCYDVSSRGFELSCRISPTSDEVVACWVDVELGLSTPYPCPCDIPAAGQVTYGFGRSIGSTELYDILRSRSEEKLIWRYIAQTMWNISAESQVPPKKAEVDGSLTAWFAQLLADTNLTFTDDAAVPERSRQRRNIVKVIRQSTDVLGDAVTLALVPGQAPVSVDTKFVSFSSTAAVVDAVPSATQSTAESLNSSRSNWSRITIELGQKARVDVDYERDSFPVKLPETVDFSDSFPSLPEELAATEIDNATTAPPKFLPVTGAAWRSDGPFWWLDSSRELLSDALQVELPGRPADPNDPAQFSRIRFRFKVPVVWKNCSGNFLTFHALCCRKRSDAQECAVPDAETTTTLVPPETTTTEAPTPEPLPPDGYLLQIGGRKLPFDGPVAMLFLKSLFWIPAQAKASVAGTHLRIQGGDMRLGHVCTASSSTHVHLRSGGLMQDFTRDGPMCSGIFDILSSRPSWPTYGVGQTIVDGTLGGRDTSEAYNYIPPTYGNETERQNWCDEETVATKFWCRHGFDNDTDPIFADVEIVDPGGVILLGFSGVQVSLYGSSESTISTARGTHASVYAATADVPLYQMMHIMYFSSMEKLEIDGEVDELAEVKRAFDIVGTTTSTTTTTTTTSTITETRTTTTTTTTTPVPLAPLPSKQPAPGVLLQLLEGVFESYFEFITTDGLTNSSGYLAPQYSTVFENSSYLPNDTRSGREILHSRRMRALEPFGDRIMESALVLDAWSKGAMEMSTTTTTTTKEMATTTSEPPEEEVFVDPCASADCHAIETCPLGWDATEDFECVAWSTSVMRWVPALGCRLLQPAKLSDLTSFGDLSQPNVAEVVCECLRGVLHNLVAVARKLEIVGREPFLRIGYREIYVSWWGKINQYNARGAWFFVFFLVVALIHVLCACREEHIWRKRARWVVSKCERDKANEKEIVDMEARFLHFKQRRVEELRSLRPRPMREDLIPDIDDKDLLKDTMGSPNREMLAITAGCAAGQPIEMGSPAITAGSPVGAQRLPPLSLASSQQLVLQGDSQVTAAANVDSDPLANSVTVRFVGALLGETRAAGQEGVDSHLQTPPQNSSNPTPQTPEMFTPQNIEVDVELDLDHARTVIQPLDSPSSDNSGTGRLRVWETATLEREVHQSGMEFEVLRSINQTLASWVPDRPARNRPGGGTALAVRPHGELAVQPNAAELAIQENNQSDVANRKVELEEPDPMINERGPRPIPLSLSERFWLAVDRAKPSNVWRACKMHHKIFFLPLDTQVHIFSAPERVGVMYFTLLIHMLFLALFVYRDATFRPGEDPSCEQLGVMSWSCFGYFPATSCMFESAFLSFVLSNLFMIAARGRPFPARTRYMTDEQREQAFTHHVLGHFPMCWHEPKQVLMSAKVLWAYARGYPYTGNRPKHTLMWQPSVVLTSFVILVPVAFLILLHVMFFYSSTTIMDEYTYSDRPGYLEILYPVLEREEVEASSREFMKLSRIFIPHFQRYLVLLILSLIIHLFILEPLSFAVHLFIGEPSLETFMDQCVVAWKRIPQPENGWKGAWQQWWRRTKHLKVLQRGAWQQWYQRLSRWRRTKTAVAQASGQADIIQVAEPQPPVVQAPMDKEDGQAESRPLPGQPDQPPASVVH